MTQRGIDLADRMHGQCRGPDHPDGDIGQGQDPLGLRIAFEQARQDALHVGEAGRLVRLHRSLPQLVLQAGRIANRQDWREISAARNYRNRNQAARIPSGMPKGLNRFSG